ncbi:unnamed protein product, partial [Symbiodinium necroappetens]
MQARTVGIDSSYLGWHSSLPGLAPLLQRALRGDFIWPQSAAQQPPQAGWWQNKSPSPESEMQPLTEDPLWWFMVSLIRELALARQYRSMSNALLPKLHAVNLTSLQSSMSENYVGCELLEKMVATLMWEAPRLEQLRLPQHCHLQPQKLQKALRQHPNTAAVSRAFCGWLPPQTTSSMQTAHVLDAMAIESAQ